MNPHLRHIILTISNLFQFKMSSNKFKIFISEAVEGDMPTEETLFKIIKLITRDESYNHKTNFLLEGINSQKIVKLLSFLEHENIKMRKLSLLFFALVVANAKSKVYFLEKCGFGLSFGRVLFTRLKYLQNSIPKHVEGIQIVRSFLMALNGSKRGKKSVLFWYVPLINLEEPILKVLYFDESLIENKNSIDVLLEIIPDSIENMCGFEFSEWDLPEHEIRESLVISDRSRTIKATLDEEVDICKDQKRILKPKLTVERSIEFAEFKNKKEIGMSPLNKSSANKTKSPGLDVFQKYRSSIKDRTPSLNVKKEGKSSSIIVSKKLNQSPLKTPRGYEPKMENKNVKSQKIPDVLTKSKVSKSPTMNESRSNVSERLSKVLGVRSKY